jgi:hypothetical protein
MSKERIRTIKTPKVKASISGSLITRAVVRAMSADAGGILPAKKRASAAKSSSKTSAAKKSSKKIYSKSSKRAISSKKSTRMVG